MLQNRCGIIFGVANRHSIAWSVAQSQAAAGARLAFCFKDERSREQLKSLTREMSGALILHCDVADHENVTEAFAQVKEKFGRLDFLVHSLAFAPREALRGEYLDTSREAFLTTLDISVYSLVVLARAAAPLMTEGGSIVTMTYYGAEKVVPNYNMMGVAKAALEASMRYLAADLGKDNIRVNAISSGPVNTLSSRAISHCSELIKCYAEIAPLQRNVEAREVGDCALFLCSPFSSGITGEVVHVDCGYNIIGYSNHESSELRRIKRT